MFDSRICAVVLRTETRPAAESGATGAEAGSVSAEHLSEFEQRLRECHRVVYQVAYGVLRDRADAEEIAQDAFLQAYRKFSSLREVATFRAWVARTSFRLALNRLRSMTRSRQRDFSWLAAQASSAQNVSSGNVEAIVVQRDFEIRLAQAIDRLPEKLRAVMLLSAVQELDTGNIAAVLDIPEGTVRSRRHLARKELLKVFEDEDLS